MKLHTTNYYDTFIAIADDCKATLGETPIQKGDNQTAAYLQFEMLAKQPYQYTSDEVLFSVFALRHELTEDELAAAKVQFFSRGQACMRASALTKRYGWGIHHNSDGKMAIYGCETPEYLDFLNQKGIAVVKAMRSKK